MTAVLRAVAGLRFMFFLWHSPSMAQSEGVCCDAHGRCPNDRGWAGITEGTGPVPSVTICTIERAARLFAQFAEHDDSIIFVPPDKVPAESTMADLAVLLYLVAVTALLTVGVVQGCARSHDYRPVCSDLSADDHVPACA